MAKYKIYRFSFNGELFESDSMRDCVMQYYKSPKRVWFEPVRDFDEKFDNEIEGWEEYFKRDPERIVEFEVEGG